jgi:Ni,Fe-hydrogenase III component G
MMKRKFDAGKNESKRLKGAKEKEKKRAEEAKTTEVSDNLSNENFRALYSTKKSIILACPEDRLPKNNHRGFFVVLYSMVKKFIDLLMEATDFSILEKLTFEDVPVSGPMMQKLFRTLALPNL